MLAWAPWPPASLALGPIGREALVRNRAVAIAHIRGIASLRATALEDGVTVFGTTANIASGLRARAIRALLRGTGRTVVGFDLQLLGDDTSSDTCSESRGQILDGGLP